MQTLCNRFSIPGHATKREFAVYIVFARRPNDQQFFAYVGKTGDNREGCNPVISRAGNHFSYNKIHSQVRNKIGADPHLFDYEYFYVTFDAYVEGDTNQRGKIDVVNEMERATNEALRCRLSPAFRGALLNEFKGRGWIKESERKARKALMTQERREKVAALVDAALAFIASFNGNAVLPPD